MRSGGMNRVPIALEWLKKSLKDGCSRKNCNRTGLRGAELVINRKLVCVPCNNFELMKQGKTIRKRRRK
jgi:hypothetical protein